MKRSRFFPVVLALVMIALSTVACKLGQTPPTSTPPTARPTETPLPPSPTEILYLPTLAPTPTLEPYVYYVPEYGLRIRYPDQWIVSETNDYGNIAQLTSQDERVLALYYAEPEQEEKDLQTIAEEQTAAQLQGLEDIQTVLSQPAYLANGQKGWSIISTAQIPDSAKIKINVTTSVYRGVVFTILAYSNVAGYDTHSGEIDTLIAGTALESPTFYGIPRDQALILEGGETTNPREYDPATTHSSGDKRIFSGLVSFDPNLNLVPELAENWEVSPDGTVYTFHIQPDAKFHNGRDVTAQDVIYSWERAAAPETGSDTVLTYLGDIVGIKEMNAGTAQNISGLKAIDEHTLQVTIDAPKPYFLMKLTFPTAFVVDKNNVESGEEWYRTPNGTGPYRLIQWEHFKYMIYERNPDYYLSAPEIPYIIEQLYSGSPIRLYEMGQVDMAGVAGYDVPRVTDPANPMSKEYTSAVSLCTSYVNFDNNQPPFDDPKVRQAFTLAFDKQKYVDIVFSGEAVPAKGLYPPGLPGFNPELEGWSYDPEHARQLLAESKYGGAENLPPIVYTDNGLGNDASPGTAALVDMWQKNLGVSITVENLEPNVYSEQINAGNHGQIFDGGWCADYPDPENFADALFYTGAQQNQSNYSNPEVDKILEQARVEQDINKRIELYQQAEEIIVNDAPVLFTVHHISHMLVKPYVKGYELTPIDIPMEKYLWLEWK